MRACPTVSITLSCPNVVRASALQVFRTTRADGFAKRVAAVVRSIKQNSYDQADNHDCDVELEAESDDPDA